MDPTSRISISHSTSQETSNSKNSESRPFISEISTRVLLKNEHVEEKAAMSPKKAVSPVKTEKSISKIIKLAKQIENLPLNQDTFSIIIDELHEPNGLSDFLKSRLRIFPLETLATLKALQKWINPKSLEEFALDCCHHYSMWDQTSRQKVMTILEGFNAPPPLFKKMHEIVMEEVLKDPDPDAQSLLETVSRLSYPDETDNYASIELNLKKAVEKLPEEELLQFLDTNFYFPNDPNQRIKKTLIQIYASYHPKKALKYHEVFPKKERRNFILLCASYHAALKRKKSFTLLSFDEQIEFFIQDLKDTKLPFKEFKACLEVLEKSNFRMDFLKYQAKNNLDVLLYLKKLNLLPHSDKQHPLKLTPASFNALAEISLLRFEKAKYVNSTENLKEFIDLFLETTEPIFDRFTQWFMGKISLYGNSFTDFLNKLKSKEKQLNFINFRMRKDPLNTLRDIFTLKLLQAKNSPLTEDTFAEMIIQSRDNLNISNSDGYNFENFLIYISQGSATTFKRIFEKIFETIIKPALIKDCSNYGYLARFYLDRLAKIDLPYKEEGEAILKDFCYRILAIVPQNSFDRVLEGFFTSSRYYRPYPENRQKMLARAYGFYYPTQAIRNLSSFQCYTKDEKMDFLVYCGDNHARQVKAQKEAQEKSLAEKEKKAAEEKQEEKKASEKSKGFFNTLKSWF